MNLTIYITDVIEGRKGGICIKGALYAISHLFKAGVMLRNFAFDKQWFKETKVALPIVSIGNIIAGGTGKTPLIKKLATDLSPNWKVSVLLRGYRSEKERCGQMLNRSKHCHITPKSCGDEAYLLWNCLLYTSDAADE